MEYSAKFHPVATSPKHLSPLVPEPVHQDPTVSLLPTDVAAAPAYTVAAPVTTDATAVTAIATPLPPWNQIPTELQPFL